MYHAISMYHSNDLCSLCSIARNYVLTVKGLSFLIETEGCFIYHSISMYHSNDFYFSLSHSKKLRSYCKGAIFF